MAVRFMQGNRATMKSKHRRSQPENLLVGPESIIKGVDPTLCREDSNLTEKYFDHHRRTQKFNQSTTDLKSPTIGVEIRALLMRAFSKWITSYKGESFQKILFTLVCSFLLMTAALVRGFEYTPLEDVFVYCVVYSVWVCTCLPWLLLKLNRKTISLLVGVLVRLFAADIGVLGWAAWRGDTHILHRGLRLKPVMESSLSWLSEAGYSLRFGVIVASISAATIKYVIDTIFPSPSLANQSPNRSQSNINPPQEWSAGHNTQKRVSPAQSQAPCSSIFDDGFKSSERKDVGQNRKNNNRTISNKRSPVKSSPPKTYREQRRQCGKEIHGSRDESPFEKPWNKINPTIFNPAKRWGHKSDNCSKNLIFPRHQDVSFNKSMEIENYYQEENNFSPTELGGDGINGTAMTSQSQQTQVQPQFSQSQQTQVQPPFSQSDQTKVQPPLSQLKETDESAGTVEWRENDWNKKREKLLEPGLCGSYVWNNLLKRKTLKNKTMAINTGNQKGKTRLKKATKL